jgi:flagellar biosynthesis anti-sigma factor FlgM
MSIDFRNPLANQGTLLARLRAMIGQPAAPEETAASAGSMTTGRQSDRVSLSNDAQRIADQMRGNEYPAHYDADRVAALKQAIESGTFRIDTARIADKVSLQYGGPSQE